MNATTSAAVYGALAGAGLEAELAHARVTDDDARDAALAERDGRASVVPIAPRRGRLIGIPRAARSRETIKISKHTPERAADANGRWVASRGGFGGRFQNLIGILFCRQICNVHLVDPAQAGTQTPQ